MNQQRGVPMTKISAIEGNQQWLDGGSMFGNAPRAMWERWVEVDSQHRVRLSTRSLLIEHGEERILCETGIGAFFDPKMAERFGIESTEHLLLQSLKKLDLDHEDITTVILSHLHFDHAGGLLPSYNDIQNGNNGMLFPNAKLVVGKAHFEHSQKPHFRDRASYIPDLANKLKDSGRLILVDQEKIPGFLEDHLSFFFTSGHTPGQMHTVFKGDETSVVFVGDLIPGTPWVHLPITMGYDRFPELLIDEKKKFYEKALPEKWKLFYTHDTECAVSQIALNEKQKYYAVACQREVIRENL